MGGSPGGENSMAFDYTPKSDNYNVGGVVILIKKTGSAKRIHLGNLTDVSVDPTNETLDHFTSRTGVRRKDRQIVTSRGMTITGNIEEWTPDINQLLLAASSAPTTVHQAAVSANTMTDQDTSPGNTVLLDHQNVDNVSVEGGSTLIEGTDYVVDNEIGAVSFLNHSGDTTSDITYDANEIDAKELSIFTETDIINLSEITLMFKTQDGSWFRIKHGKGTFTTTSPYSFNDQDWSSVGFSIELLDDGTATPFGTERQK